MVWDGPSCGITLGRRPPKLTVYLVPGSSYNAAVESTQPWAPDDVIDLCFGDSTDPVIWQAAITGSLAAWTKTAAQVAEILTSRLTQVDLRLTRPGHDPLVWYRGTVQVVTR